MWVLGTAEEEVPEVCLKESYSSISEEIKTGIFLKNAVRKEYKC